MEYGEAFEKAREAFVKAAKFLKEAFMRIAEWFKANAQTIYEFVNRYEAEQKKAKSLRHSWIVKQDTRKLNQVMCNKPRVNLPRILY
jgi:hypothetical protein